MKCLAGECKRKWNRIKECIFNKTCWNSLALFFYNFCRILCTGMAVTKMTASWYFNTNQHWLKTLKKQNFDRMLCFTYSKFYVSNQHSYFYINVYIINSSTSGIGTFWHRLRTKLWWAYFFLEELKWYISS
jgi:hypothetical protein